MNARRPIFPGARPSRRSGSALVITLAVLVLMSIMVISLSDMTRVERGAARSHLEKARAELLAQTGAAKVVARLRKETADPARNWISQPGQLVASDPLSTSTKTVADPPIPLSSGAPVVVTSSFVPGVLRPAQLNVPTFEQGATGMIPPHLITNLPDPANAAQAVPMAVRWVYVRKDGSEDLAEQPVLSDKTNPIVGRYAYWTDDESSKVNYNLAWTRGSNNPNPASHPTRINLPTLFGAADPDAEAKAAAIHLYDPFATQTQPIPATSAAYRAISRFFFQTPEDARQVERIQPGVDASLLATKFNVTHYNHDPDTTFFNEPRIVLTTRKDRAGGRPFLKISAVDNVDLGNLSSIDNNELTKKINKLNSYLQRTDWPMAPGASLQSKYYTGNANRLTQLSLNIIDYVRSKESNKPIVVPLRGTYLGNNFNIVIGTDPNSYLAIARAPRITEVGLFVSRTAQSGKTYAAKLKVEVYLPKNFGIASLDLTTLQMFQDLYFEDGTSTNQPLHVTLAEAPITSAEVAPVGPLLPGSRATITRTFTITYTASRPASESVALARIAIAQTGAPGVSNRLDIVPLLGGKGDYAKVKVNAPDVGEAIMPSVEVDDPRINSHKDDWKQVAANSFGALNHVSTIGAAPNAAIIPQQDAGSDGKITDVSLVIPAPSGSTTPGLSSNPNGVVASAGELGYISTGMQSAGMAGAPWRTLRLQPNKQTTAVVPDWAFMDLFTVPADVPPDVAGKPSPKAIFSPHGTESGGRVNMNARPEPFNLDRLDPLGAVFEGATYDATDLTKKLDNPTARAIAAAVYHRDLAVASTVCPAGKQYGYQSGYDSPGEVVEMRGVADRGEAGEQLVREIANLITSRGNVFSVYTVGQALRQTPAGDLVVTGEQRQQSMIERYSDGSTIHIRPVYFRNLTP
jgi:hypothetical protein